MSEASEHEVGAPSEASKTTINACAEVTDACRDGMAKVLCDVAMAPLFRIEIGGVGREPVPLDLRMCAEGLFDDSRTRGIAPIPANEEAAGDMVLHMAEGEHNVLPTDRLRKVALIDTTREGSPHHRGACPALADASQDRRLPHRGPGRPSPGSE
jgi:hypothetical protein